MTLKLLLATLISRWLHEGCDGLGNFYCLLDLEGIKQFIFRELNLLHVALKLGKMILLLAGPSQMAH